MLCNHDERFKLLQLPKQDRLNALRMLTDREIANMYVTRSQCSMRKAEERMRITRSQSAAAEACTSAFR